MTNQLEIKNYLSKLKLIPFYVDRTDKIVEAIDDVSLHTYCLIMHNDMKNLERAKEFKKLASHWPSTK